MRVGDKNNNNPNPPFSLSVTIHTHIYTIYTHTYTLYIHIHRLTAANNTKTQSSSSSQSSELLAIDRLRGVLIELARTTSARQSNIHIGPLLDNITELEAVKRILVKNVQELLSEVNEAKYSRDLNDDR